MTFRHIITAGIKLGRRYHQRSLGCRNGIRIVFLQFGQIGVDSFWIGFLLRLFHHLRQYGGGFLIF